MPDRGCRRSTFATVPLALVQKLLACVYCLLFAGCQEEGLSKTRFRSLPLTIAGGSWPALVWAARRCRPFGVQVSRKQGLVELRKGDRAMLLVPKHLFFAPAVARDFERLAYALPAAMQDGVPTVDFACDPELLNLCRRCLQYGVTIENRDQTIWLHRDDQVMVLALKHLLYAGDMAERFDLYFSPLVPELREGLQVLNYSEPGRLQTYRSSGLQFEMASFPEEEEAIEEYFRWYRPQPGDLVFDLGAHCGVSTYALAKLVGAEGRVVAFEPDPVNFAILQRNLERHGLRNVIAENVAIAGTAGRLAFSSEGTIGSTLLSTLVGRETVGSMVMVEALTLGDAYARWGVPAFCKIDIEGAEIEVLNASSELLRSHRTNFALDTNHPMANGELTSGRVETILRGNGYEVASEANPLMTTWARKR